MLLCAKVIILLFLYLVRQRICKKKVRLEHIVITLILALYTKPIIEDIVMGWFEC